ncbi:40S ribosomal protein S28 [Encephalitozoon intestinalis ATCC 50506]|uniref:40S ribosomal protein S28 n=1 Tax=Encephalitozoon intestinalis (strain ATCC 50506) TaxID=876142 RepID=E0S907_ENCIT|nr:40S ribosomal protein S28 [Encephalitozoon intestinalis ATCC 50506]ADM12272.1 40S ribosomal protein S28 [Encephalitozoon intestinalis ATCC 50506]UTX46079.1 ribosomal protein S28 [Encephalitozoon intestinalis]
MEDQQEFFGKVTQVLGRTGGSGLLTQVKMELIHNKRMIQRAIKGPISEGDFVEILECEREHRRTR